MLLLSSDSMAFEGTSQFKIFKRIMSKRYSKASVSRIIQCASLRICICLFYEGPVYPSLWYSLVESRSQLNEMKIKWRWQKTTKGDNKGGMIMKHLLRLLLSLVSEKALLMIYNFVYSSLILQCQLLVGLN